MKKKKKKCTREHANLVEKNTWNKLNLNELTDDERRSTNRSTPNSNNTSNTITEQDGLDVPDAVVMKEFSRTERT